MLNISYAAKKMILSLEKMPSSVVVWEIKVFLVDEQKFKSSRMKRSKFQVTSRGPKSNQVYINNQILHQCCFNDGKSMFLKYKDATVRNLTICRNQANRNVKGLNFYALIDADLTSHYTIPAALLAHSAELCLLEEEHVVFQSRIVK